MSRLAAWRQLRHRLPGPGHRSAARTALQRTHADAGGELGVAAACGPFPARIACRRLLATDTGPRDEQAASGEKRLLVALQGLSQTGSLAQREAAWGLYEHLAAAGVSIHEFSLDTVLLLMELVASDKDLVRVLARITTILQHRTAQRRLPDSEVETIQRLWEDIGAARTSPANWTPFAREPRPPASSRQHTKPTPRRHQATCLPSSDAFAADADPAETTSAQSAIKELREMLLSPPLTMDLGRLWRTYRSVMHAQPSAGADDRLIDSDMTRLVRYSINFGTISGERFLAQIEVDLAAVPDLFPGRYPHLMYSYAKLGLLEHSRRLYAAALAAGENDAKLDVDWYMCLSLFVALHQREGLAMFGRLVEEGRATPSMYGLVLRELVLGQQIDRAFALFDDMCARGVWPTSLTRVMLAQAAAQVKDSAESNARLSGLVAYMKSWHIAPDADFFAGLLQGYGWSGQNDMFDGLAARVKAHSSQRWRDINRAILANASKRSNAALTVAMARAVAHMPMEVEAVVKGLCDVGRPDVVPTLVDLAGLPDNNRTANLRLELALNDPSVALDPLQLQSQVLEMLGRGFTPTFRMSKAVISAIWLHGGVELAIAAYERLIPAGMPKTVGVLLIALQLYASSTNPKLGLDVFDELRKRLAVADYAVVALPGPALEKLTALAIATRGIDAAQTMFDVLADQKAWSRGLPFTPLIEYYINHDMRNRTQAMIARAMKQGIAVGERGANLCGRHLAETASVTVLTGFLRHLQRTGELGLVANDVIVKFFAMCAARYKKADFEWALAALAELDRDIETWRAIVQQLAASSSRLLVAMVHVLIGLDSERMAPVILHAAKGLPQRAVIANMVLAALGARGVRPSSTTCDLALSAFVIAWQAQRRRTGHGPPGDITPTYLTRSVSQIIDDVVSVGVRPRLFTMAMLILASEKRRAHFRCLEILSTLPLEQRSVMFYGAIARGCERLGSIRGIGEVMLAMEVDGVEPTAGLLEVVAECYANLRPPPWQTQPPDAEDHDDEGRVSDGPEVGLFYKKCLARALDVWREFDLRGLPPSDRTCGAILTAMSRAHKGAQGEEFVALLHQQGLEHGRCTALGWIRLRLAVNDVDGAHLVLGAIGNASRCRLLASGDPRYQGLDAVPLVPDHFGAFIQHYISRDEPTHAVAVMDAMHKRRSRSEPQLYAELLRALANHHEKSAFVHVMKQMLAAGARPNSLVMDVVRDYTALREHQGPDSPSAGQEPHDEDNDDAGADDHYGDDDEPRSF